MRRVAPAALLAVVALAVVLGSTAAPVVAQTAERSGQVIGQPDIELFATNQEFEPGTRAELGLTLTNRGSISQGGPARYEDRVTTARGVVVEARSGGAPVSVTTGPVGVGNVPTGTEPVPPVSITVSENASPGSYRIPVELSYAYTRGVSYDVYGPEYDDFTETETHYVTIRVREQARFAVVGQSSTAQVGDRGRLSVTVENVGSRAARDASVSARSSSDELRFGTGSASSTAGVGAWRPGERQTVAYTVELADDATLREYSLDLAVDYLDTDGLDRRSRSLSVGLRPAAEQSFSLTNVSASLRVGEEGTVSATVLNRGPAPATNPVVTLATSNSDVVIDAAEYALPDLAPGERATVEYTVTVSDAASASVQQFGFTPRYRTARGDVRTGDGLDATVRVEPRRDRFGVETTTDGVTAGDERAVTVRITNEGDEPLTNVEAKAFVRSPLSSDDDEGIVPSLAPGETAEFTISLSAAGDALPKRYPVSFDLQYQLPDGDTEVSKTYTTAVTVTAPEGGGFPTGPVAGVVVLVGAAALVGWRRRSD